ncbi:GMC oxidoreductase-domain-containing protein, partial [Schizophyllum commune]
MPTGIGNKELLKKHGIKTVVDLPGVGENLREHIYVPTAFELKEGLESWDELQNPKRLEEEIKKYYSERKGMLTTLPYSYGYIPWQVVTPEAEVRAAVAEALKDSGEAFPSVARTWALQRELLDNPAIAALEIMQAANYHPAVGITPEPGKVHCSIGGLLQRAFSRGSVHIQSADPLAAPAIDPQFLSKKADLTLLVDSVRFIRKLVQTEGYKAALTREVAPGPAVQTQEELEKYVIDNFQTVFHPVSTATMLPREDGGVVDANLKVYGTANVRVADASVIPLHIAAHPQSTVYAIAEK